MAGPQQPEAPEPDVSIEDRDRGAARATVPRRAARAVTGRAPLAIESHETDHPVSAKEFARAKIAVPSGLSENR